MTVSAIDTEADLHAAKNKGDAPEASQSVSLNIFWRYKKAGLCKTNCKSIEVTVLYPSSASPFWSQISSPDCGVDDSWGLQLKDPEPQGLDEALEHPTGEFMGADPGLEVSPIASNTGEEDLSLTTTASDHVFFPFMSLPLELRLKIYAYLLPARHHNIITQLPNNGYYYTTCTIPSHAAQSFYALGTPSSAQNKLTTYKVLSADPRASVPGPSIHPEILRVSRTVRAEAEPVLYGNAEAVWDFGIHLEALKAFWSDRSKGARAHVRNVRVAREVPGFERGMVVKREANPRWVGLCDFVKSELLGLRTLDLTLWSPSRSTNSSPASNGVSGGGGGLALPAEAGEEVVMLKVEEARGWREWEWTRDLLQLDALRLARTTWWGLPESEMGAWRE